MQQLDTSIMLPACGTAAARLLPFYTDGMDTNANEMNEIPRALYERGTRINTRCVRIDHFFGLAISTDEAGLLDPL